MESPDLRREAARRFLAAGDGHRAVEALQDDPTGESWGLLGDGYFLIARYDQAERCWKKSLDDNPATAGLAEKLERAAAAWASGVGESEPQSLIFAEYFQRDRLLSGPNPGNPVSTSLPTHHHPTLVDQLEEVAGAALGMVGGFVLHRLADVVGETGVNDGVHSNWFKAGQELPENLRPAMQILKLAFMRDSLFANNLVRPYAEGDKTGFWETNAEPPAWAHFWRSADGSWNDLKKDEDGRYDPMVGAAWTRFFRNVGDDKGLAATWPRPNPATNPVSVRELSRALLLPQGPRKEVPFLNLWAGSWIQFMVHGWVSHGTPDHTRADRLPLQPDDPFRQRYGIEFLSIPATPDDPTRMEAEKGRPPTHLNEVTHWWDGSQIYGSDLATQHALRLMDGGKLKVQEDGSLPVDGATGVEQTGFSRNWWIGLTMLHTLFVREHNAICAHLAARYPSWGDERLFQTARLINAAVMAKIHTVEWTPAILANRTLHESMHANWYGILSSLFNGGQKKTLEPLRISTPELGGIVGGAQGTFARFGLSEEFTAVYRLHSLLPDVFKVGDTEIPLHRTRHRLAKEILKKHGFVAVSEAMGIQHPGALVNNNFPAALLEMSGPGMPVMDLGAIDLYRDRERGVPPYNQLRKELGLPRVPSFDLLTDDPETAKRLRQMYGVDESGNDRVDDVDLLIGTLCEGHRPDGFGFGETLFQVFILNASWRLLGDRFYTDDYRPEIYTPEGIDWVDEATMKSVLLRHFPELEKTGLGNIRNAFEPWDEGRLDPARHPTRAFEKDPDPWAGTGSLFFIYYPLTTPFPKLHKGSTIAGRYC